MKTKKIKMNYEIKIKKLEQQIKRYKRLSFQDDLTGLFNKRKLVIDLNRYSSLQKRFRISFFIMFIDLDGFKKINDKEGHLKGDNFLQFIAKTLTNSIRDYENIYRFGGDEFIIIFSHTDNTKFLKDKIKKILINNNIKASIGICKLGQNCLNKVDKLMYKDKQGK